MYNENQPRTSDGRFGAVPHAESDDELSAAAQLSEWQVLELARPGGKTHTVRAADPITARSLVLNDVSTKGRHGERAASLWGQFPAGEQTERLGNGRKPELERWQLQFAMITSGHNRACVYVGR